MSAYLVRKADEQPSYFLGFPYLITQLTTGLHHISLLPASIGLRRWMEIAIKQVRANKLPTCLVLDSERCVYFKSNGLGTASHDIPVISFIAINRLKLSEEFKESEELLARKKQLLEYELKMNGADSKYITGDLQKGGRVATSEELKKLDGYQSNGVPIGLTRCNSCGQWEGECIDNSNPNFKGLLVNVFCSCRNYHNLCARCGEPLYRYRLNANYYSQSTNAIWHVPGFCGLDHECDNET